MKNEDFTHQPVLLEEVIESLDVKPDGFYIDATFGRGGHSQAILARLNEQGSLLVIDKDPQAVAVAKTLLANDTRCTVVQGSFSQLSHLVGNRKADGLLLDLGVSSPQLDDPNRGFSFLHDGPLDMRMDTTQGLDAATWLAQATVAEIVEVLQSYGEERYAKRIANAIDKMRQQQAIQRTSQLAEIIAKANPRWEHHKHPATRSFQAIRIFINRELDELKIALSMSLEALKIGGRLVVISFHSLEDRIVKRFMQGEARGQQLPKEIPILLEQMQPRLRILGKALRPTTEEIKKNPRARSAILRRGEILR